VLYQGSEDGRNLLGGVIHELKLARFYTGDGISRSEQITETLKASAPKNTHRFKERSWFVRGVSSGELTAFSYSRWLSRDSGQVMRDGWNRVFAGALGKVGGDYPSLSQGVPSSVSLTDFSIWEDGISGDRQNPTRRSERRDFLERNQGSRRLQPPPPPPRGLLSRWLLSTKAFHLIV